MNILEFLKKELKNNDFDGLICEDCACKLLNIGKCGQFVLKCRPAYLHEIVKKEKEGYISKYTFYHELNKIIHYCLKEYSNYYCEEFSFDTICKKNRKPEFVRPRQTIHYFARKRTNLSLATIGDLIGKKDHATVAHSVKTMQNLIDTEVEFRELIKTIEDQLN